MVLKFTVGGIGKAPGSGKRNYAQLILELTEEGKNFLSYYT